MSTTKATTIEEYNNLQTEVNKEIRDTLKKEISKELKEAESKIWHGGPVWFINGNPIVGYWVRKSEVQLLFWSGQSFDADGLEAEGKFKAAQKIYIDSSEIDKDKLNKLLKESREIQWDYKNIVKQKRKLTKIMQPITIETIIDTPITKVWQYWTKPEHIVKWAFATDEWEAPSAENDLQIGGKFKTLMAAKDKSAQFDFEGIYTNIIENKLIEYDLGDGRHVKIEFSESPEGVKVIQTFDPEKENDAEFQKAGWQAILDNFKKYTESN